MSYTVTTQTAVSIPIAAVRRRVFIPEIASAWKPALDLVWTYLRAHPEIKPGHNVFLYHHPSNRDDPMDVDFGVGVGANFFGDGIVNLAATPAGEVATTMHVGPYRGMPEAHQAVHSWCAANGKMIGAASWEIYGDWEEDESKLETQIVYLLR